MHLITSKGKTGPDANQKPVLQTHEATLVGAASMQCATPDCRLEALQRQFSAFGLSLSQLGCGQELALTGPLIGFKSLPDARCAWMVLRQLRGIA
jgi:hypothetical protein